MNNNVNPKRSNDNFTRFFQLNQKMFLENNLDFFNDLETFLDKYECNTIQALLDAFVLEVKKQNIPLYYEKGVDPEILNWLPEAKVIKNLAPKGDFISIKNKKNERVMLETALKLPLSQAIEKMTKAVRNLYFNKNSWIVIFLTDTLRDGTPLKLTCECTREGELCLKLDRVHLNNDWRLTSDFRWFLETVN